MSIYDLDFTAVKPYGDKLNDGITQVSFTLPLPYGEKAGEAAKHLAKKMGLKDPDVAYHMDLGEDFTYFIVYGKCLHTVDYTQISIEKDEFTSMKQADVEKFVHDHICRDIVVVGACTGTDIHTVGIDAIMNMKGFDGEYGLERYKHFKAYNLGGQVPNKTLVMKALEVKADAVLVSQIITQNNHHVHNLTELVDLLEAEGIRDDILLICGGPRLSDELAKELGYDKGFSVGTYPNHVASYIAREIYEKTAIKTAVA